MKIILTGATGMAGEGVLLTCLKQPQVKEVLMVNRRPYPLGHPKLKELLVPDFLNMDAVKQQLSGYDACFFCAGISSVGMDEKTYTRITYDTTLYFAKTVLAQNPGLIFTYITGSGTNSSEKGKVMWARVKGKTENDLMKLGFKGLYNFRPGGMLPVAGQKNAKTIYKVIVKILMLFMAKKILTLEEVGMAMINVSDKGYKKQVLEIEDIKAVAKLKHG